MLETRRPMLYASLIVRARGAVPFCSCKAGPPTFFAPMAWAYIAAVSISMLVALLVTPPSPRCFSQCVADPQGRFGPSKQIGQARRSDCRPPCPRAARLHRSRRRSGDRVLSALALARTQFGTQLQGDRSGHRMAGPASTSLQAMTQSTERLNSGPAANPEYETPPPISDAPSFVTANAQRTSTRGRCGSTSIRRRS